MKLIRLTKDTIIKSFDCGDADLNDFILNDAKAFLSKRIAYTFLIIDGENQQIQKPPTQPLVPY